MGCVCVKGVCGRLLSRFVYIVISSGEFTRKDRWVGSLSDTLDMIDAVPKSYCYSLRYTES